MRIQVRDIRLEEDFDSFTVILLIRWIQNYVGGGHTLANIAYNILGVPLPVLNRFLARKLNRDEESARAREYAIKIRTILDQGRPFPPAIRDLVEQVYGDVDSDVGSVKDPAALRPIKNPAVLRHRSMARIPKHAAEIAPFYGLSALVRTSNEYVEPADEDEIGQQPGWSISIFYVVPDHIQRGLNHPLFVLRQKGLNRAGVTIEGVVITQEDRFILQGVDTISSRPFHAYISIGESWSEYRNFDRDRPVFTPGVMVGLSSERGVFAGLFDLFAIPRTSIERDAKPEEKQAFSDRYQAIVEEAAGVRNLADTVAQLETLGIKGGTDWLKETLRDIRDRAKGKILLKP